MNIIIVLLFLTGLVIGHLDRSKKYFISENLYKKKFDTFKNYIPVRELKHQINENDNPAIVANLKKYLFYKRLSRALIFLSFILLISGRFI